MNKATGIQRILNATNYSMQGLKAAWKNEAAFRQECFLLIIAVIIALLLDVSWLHRALLVSTVLLVIIVELINSAIEAVVDRIGSEQHELSGRAKDIGSAAVFVALCLAGLCWVAVIYSRYLG